MDKLNTYRLVLKSISEFFRRGTVKMVDTKTPIQKLQVKLSDAKLVDDVEHIEPYGLTANPPLNSEVLTAGIGADRSKLVALSVSGRNVRPKDLTAGQVVLYDKSGTNIKLANDGTVIIKAKTEINITTDAKVNLKAASVSVEAGEVKLGKSAAFGVVNTGCACVIGGLHPMGSQTIKSSI